MRKNIFLVAYISMATTIFLTNCKPNKVPDPIPVVEISAADEASIALQSSDNSDIESNINEAMTDINSYGNGSSIREEENTCSGVSYSNVTINGSGGIRKKLTISFNSSTCRGFIRTGSAIVTLTGGNKFNDVGATWTVNLENYTVTKNGKTAVMNGIWNIVNVNGGYVGGASEVTHSMTGNVNVVFENGTNREWAMSENRVWAANGATLRIYGTANYNGFTDVIRYGKNRNGNNFYTRINFSSAVVIAKKNCSDIETIKYVSGTRIHVIEKDDVPIKRIENITLDEATCINTYTATIEKKDKKVSRIITF